MATAPAELLADPLFKERPALSVRAQLQQSLIDWLLGQRDAMGITNGPRNVILPFSNGGSLRAITLSIGDLDIRVTIHKIDRVEVTAVNRVSGSQHASGPMSKLAAIIQHLGDLSTSAVSTHA